MIIDAILNWYAERGLDPWDFQCPNLEQCSDGVENFTTARPPLLGKRYVDGSLPRLLVISSDAGSADLLQERSEYGPSGPDPKAPGYDKNKHWYRTLELVTAIQQSFDSTLQLTDAAACFAHERAVKCCENQDGNSEASREMFRNCRSFLPEQLPVYQPDIILTQGNRALWSVSGGDFPEMRSETSCANEGHDCAHRILDLGLNSAVLWLHTYHPTSRPQYYPKFRDGYFSCYPPLAKDFVEGR